MPNRRLAATLGYLTLAATDTYLAGRKGKAARRARFVTKPLLMPTLAVSTQLATEDTDGVAVRGVQAAQVFSWGGDLALMGKSERSFLAERTILVLSKNAQPINTLGKALSAIASRGRAAPAEHSVH